MSIFEWLTEKPESDVLGKGKYEKSVGDILKKVESSTASGDVARTAWLYQMASVLARRAQQWDDSIKYALLAAQHSEKEGKRFNAGWAYRSAAIAATEKKEYNDAIDFAVKGADSFMLSKSSYAAKWCYNIASEASKLSGDKEKAIRFCEKARSIEPDSETCEEICRLKEAVSHPTVDQYGVRKEVLEGEPVKFEVVVENHSKDVMSNIVVGDKDGQLANAIPTLEPGQARVLSFETQGRIGCVRSPFNFISWQGPGGITLDKDLEPAKVLVRPKIQVNAYLSPDPVLGHESELVILVKNLSSTQLYDVLIDASFHEQFSAQQGSPNAFDAIGAGEEKGTEWKIIPSVLGNQKVAEAVVSMKDEGGTEFHESVQPIFADVLEAPKKAVPREMKATEFHEEQEHLVEAAEPQPLTEQGFLDAQKRYYSQQQGFTFNGASLDLVTRHVEQHCRGMALISRKDLGDERMLMYSFRQHRMHFLLTVVMRAADGLVNLVLRLYSESKEDLLITLEAISGMIHYTITTEAEVREVGKVEIKKVINIIDSIVQRSVLGTGGEDGEVTQKKTRVRDSIVQRSGV